MNTTGYCDRKGDQANNLAAYYRRRMYKVCDQSMYKFAKIPFSKLPK